MTQNSKLSKIHTLPSATLKSHLYALFNTYARIHSKTIRQEKQRDRERGCNLRRRVKYLNGVCRFVWLFGVLYMLWTMESVLLLFPSRVSCGFREREKRVRERWSSQFIVYFMLCLFSASFCVSGVTNSNMFNNKKRIMLIHNKNSIFNIDIKNKNTKTEDSKVKKQN